ncbi:MAG: PilZ domain-containing protein [Thermodesulfobacteriota bacterium]
MAEDSRSKKRFQVVAPAVVEIEKPSGTEVETEFLNLLSRDVSAGGAFFYTDSPLPEGTRVKVDLVLMTDQLKKIESDQAMIKLVGEVVRVESGGMAVRFNKRCHILPL